MPRSTRKRWPEGKRVVANVNRASRMLYSRGAPRNGTAGTVIKMNLGSKRSTYMPGPGGGLVYVKFDDGTTMGISPNDIVSWDERIFVDDGLGSTARTRNLKVYGKRESSGSFFRGFSPTGKLLLIFGVIGIGVVAMKKAS